jgi:entericidin B
MKIACAVIATFTLAITLSSCGNTIRGMGQDTANTVNATQNAGHRVANSAK